jgi:transposase
MKKRRNYHTAEFKAKVALDAIKGDQTIAQISSKYKVDATQITRWKKEALEKMASIFTKKKDSDLEAKQDQIDRLYKQVGKLSIEVDWLQGKLGL